MKFRNRLATDLILVGCVKSKTETGDGGSDGIAGTCATLDPALWCFGKNRLAVASKTKEIEGQRMIEENIIVSEYPVRYFITFIACG